MFFLGFYTSQVVSRRLAINISRIQFKPHVTGVAETAESHALGISGNLWRFHHCGDFGFRVGLVISVVHGVRVPTLSTEPMAYGCIARAYGQWLYLSVGSDFSRCFLFESLHVSERKRIPIRCVSFLPLVATNSALIRYTFQ